MTDRGEVGDIVVTRRSVDRISIEWSIPNFHSLSGEGGDNYESSCFNAYDGQWAFVMYPFGISRDPPSEWVGLDISRVDSGPPKTFYFTLGIRGRRAVGNKRERKQEISKDDDSCCWGTFVLRSKLTDQNSRWMPGNVLTFTLDMKTDAPNVATGVEELLKSLHSLFESKRECDVIIKVQNKEFPAHRLILQARSPVFEAMFSHDMVEKHSGIVKMEDCDGETFPDFLKHVYTGSFEMISLSNVYSLYTASDKYNMGALKKECSEFIKNNMNANSFCEAITLAIKHDDKVLIEWATEFFCNNSIHIVQTAEWPIFLAENATVGNELFTKLLLKHEDIFCVKQSSIL